jgi:hypothetical protein
VLQKTIKKELKKGITARNESNGGNLGKYKSLE